MAEVELVVKGAPIFTHAKTQYARLESTATLICELSSYPGIDSVVRYFLKV